MTIKSNKTLDTELDVTWRRKGHSHIVDRFEPIVCPDCLGFGVIKTPKSKISTPCTRCQGTGEI